MASPLLYIVLEGARMDWTADRGGLRYLDPSRVAIAGISCEGMTICGATGAVLGRLHGFVVDPVGRRLRYLVVRTSGLFSRTKLVPLDAARVDVERRTIEVPVEAREARPAARFPDLETLAPAG